jgi:hypothetical protein
LKELDFYLKTIYIEHYSVSELINIIQKFKLNLQKVIKEFTILNSFYTEKISNNVEIQSKIANINSNIFKSNFLQNYFYPYILLNTNVFIKTYKDSTGKKCSITYSEQDISLYRLIPYWMLLFKLAKLSRNFPQALLADILYKNTNNQQVSKVVKWMDSTNIPSELSLYYFYFELIYYYKMEELLKDALGEEVYKEYIKYKNDKKF